MPGDAWRMQPLSPIRDLGARLEKAHEKSDTESDERSRQAV